MGDDVGDDVGVTGDLEVESPVAVDPCLPSVLSLAKLLGGQGRVAEVGSKKSRLL